MLLICVLIMLLIVVGGGKWAIIQLGLVYQFSECIDDDDDGGGGEDDDGDDNDASSTTLWQTLLYGPGQTEACERETDVWIWQQVCLQLLLY